MRRKEKEQKKKMGGGFSAGSYVEQNRFSVEFVTTYYRKSRSGILLRPRGWLVANFLIQ